MSSSVSSFVTSAPGAIATINAETSQYCYLDLDLNEYRNKLATCAAFVHATNLTYGLSSKDLLSLGGSEVKRLREYISMDHQWAAKDQDCGGIETRPPAIGSGNRIVVKLFWDVAPLACENFATLCANGSSSTPTKSSPPIGECGKPMTYKGCNIHRVVPGFVLQGGDFVLGNGSGGESIFNKKTFKDERAGLSLKHDRFGLLSMGNSGKNSNSSQFFFTLSDKTPQCDGKHVIFGEVVSGKDVLKAAEQFGTKDGTPTAPIIITDCGIFHPLHTPGAGYWFDKPDPERWNGISETFVIRPRLAIMAPSEAVIQKFQTAIGSFAAIVVSVCADDDNSSLAKINGHCDAAATTTPAAAHLLEASLENFATDIVVIAPACKDVKSKISLPKSWTTCVCCSGSSTIALNEVVLIAKPVDVLSLIWEKSWMAKHRSQWQ
jgi:cyclophilin family peptidyl-prolyl cis-trans isomerase